MNPQDYSLEPLVDSAASALWSRTWGRRLEKLGVEVCEHYADGWLDNPSYDTLVATHAPETDDEDTDRSLSYHFAPELTPEEWEERVGEPVEEGGQWDAIVTPCPPGQGGWYLVGWGYWDGPADEEEVVDHIKEWLRDVWDRHAEPARDRRDRVRNLLEKLADECQRDLRRTPEGAAVEHAARRRRRGHRGAGGADALERAEVPLVAVRAETGQRVLLGCRPRLRAQRCKPRRR
jgi:hypothetical protein